MSDFRRLVPCVCCLVAFFVLDRISQPAEAAGRYEQSLYELGAFPVARLTQPYWTNGNPGMVYGKGERVDVDGWLPPSFAPLYLTEAEKKRYGLPKKPRSYGQYMALIDIDTFRRTHDPQLFLVMRFALEDLLNEDIAVQKADVLRIYEAQIGLEPFARPLLRGQLTSNDLMRLIRTYSDGDLFKAGFLPAPRAGESEYVKFLNEQANADRWPIAARDLCFRMLLSMDEKKYRKPVREFRLANAKSAKNSGDRATLYSGLIQLHDEESMRAVNDGLTHDPSTDCRESILRSLRENGEVILVIDAVVMIANRRDGPHRATSVSRMSDQWRHNLLEYLDWAQMRTELDGTTLRKVRESIAMLQRSGQSSGR